MTTARLSADGLTTSWATRIRHRRPSPPARRGVRRRTSDPRRGSSHLSPLLRCAWDTANLPILDRRLLCRGPGPTSASSATSPSMSRAESLRTDTHNGFANRCLWTCVRAASVSPMAAASPPKQLPVSPAIYAAFSTGWKPVPSGPSAAMQPQASSGTLAMKA